MNFNFDNNIYKITYIIINHFPKRKKVIFEKNGEHSQSYNNLKIIK